MFLTMSLTTTLTLITLFSSLTLASQPQLVEPGSDDNSAECDCYLTSGPDPGYFQYHRFWDFRSIDSSFSSSSLYDDSDFTIAPPLITASENQGNEPITSSYFNTTRFNEDWQISTGNQTNYESAYECVYSSQNLYISRNLTTNSTYLTLRTSRPTEAFASTVEMDSNQKNLMHSSIRARLRVLPNNIGLAPPSSNPAINTTFANTTHPVDPGACVGFFTWESDTQESDIEILTRDPLTNIRYSNQPDYDEKTDTDYPGTSTDAVMPNGLEWTEWLDHRLDTFSDVSRWYLDGDLVLNKTINVPRKPQGMVVNLWGDGGEWSGNMSIGGEVRLGVEWIEMVFNVSGKVEGPAGGNTKRDGGLRKRHDSHCKVACWVDGPEVQKVGTPVVAFNSTTSGAAKVAGAAETGMLLGVQAMVMLVAYWLLL